jgi:hypothetical protein
MISNQAKSAAIMVNQPADGKKSIDRICKSTVLTAK